MEFPFSDHIALLEQFLAGRREIVQALERRLFGAKGKAMAQHGDRESIADIFGTCFFESPAISQHLSRMNGQLDAAHLADGFEPARQDGYSRGLDLGGARASRVPPLGQHSLAGHKRPPCLRAEPVRGVHAAAARAPERENLGLRARTTRQRQAAERLQHVQRLLDLLNAGSEPVPAGARRPMADSDRTRSADQARAPYFIKAGECVGIVQTRFVSRFTRQAPCWPAATCGRSFGTFRGARAGPSTILNCSL